MAITLVCPGKDPEAWIRAIKALDSSVDVRVWPDDHPRDEVELALAWAHPLGALNAYPNLGCISSMGAGVDHLVTDPDLPDKVRVTRLTDRELVREMADYLALAVLLRFRQFDHYQARQAQRSWDPLLPMEKADMEIGIMGLGQLGRAAAEKLSGLGFTIRGWRNCPETIPGIRTYFGDDQLDAFLAGSKILICLLPLTSRTRHILNLSLFSRLPRGAYIINVGRGGHLNEPDLIRALDLGLISGACLDVFEQEPLARDHPFWERPEIRITPHVSSITKPASVAPQVLENLNRLRKGRPLINPVDLEKEY